MIRAISPDEVDRLLPLHFMVQAIHSAARPLNFRADPDPAETRAFFCEMLGRENVRILIAETEAGQAVGYIMVEAQDIPRSAFNCARLRGFIHHIAVDPEHRRQGIGSALVMAARDWFVARGMAQWAVSYWLFNTASAGLMRKHGLEPAHLVAESRLEQVRRTDTDEGSSL